jgi:ABC-type multidrug transport system fused ATPase/permease subunit
MIGIGVAQAAEAAGAAMVDGGTSAGVMKLTGQARARRQHALDVLIGVAPKGLVTYPGGQVQQGVPLDENHSHFILADSDEWGGETRLLMTVAQDLAGDGGHVAVVLAGGESGAKAEIMEATRRGWPIFVLAGTGDLADRLSEKWRLYQTRRRRWDIRFLPGRLRYRRQPTPPSNIEDADLREIVIKADIRIVGRKTEPGQFARQITWELREEPLLKDAWHRFATYDYLAARLRSMFTRFQRVILLLGVLGTLLALINDQVKTPVLHWTVVVVPILVSVLIAVASRRAMGERWVMLRAAAESIKAEIYRYRTRCQAWADDEAKLAEARKQLVEQVNLTEKQLMQTEVSSGPVTPYAGQLPPVMYGAEADDDGLSPLGSERYLRIRVGDQLGYFHKSIRNLSRRRNVLQFIAIAAGAAGAILAAANKEIWIGLTSGASAAALAYLSTLQVDNSIVTYNQTASKLEALQRGWRLLGSADRTREAFENLVAGCEAALATELTGWVHQMKEALETLRENQKKDAEAGQPPEEKERPAGHDDAPDATKQDG